LITLCVGVAASLAWQSYGDATRQIIASSYPQAGWLAPRTARIAYGDPGTIGLPAQAAPSLDQQRLNAISIDLDAMRKTVDRIAVTQEQITRNVEKITVARSGSGARSADCRQSNSRRIQSLRGGRPQRRHANPLRNRRRRQRRADSEADRKQTANL